MLKTGWPGSFSGFDGGYAQSGKTAAQQDFLQVALIIEKFAKQLVDESLYLQRGTIIGVDRGEHNIHAMAGVAGRQMEFEPIKPADRAMPAGS